MATPKWLKLPFPEAIAYFKNKTPIPTERWNQFDAEQHDFAFTISGLTRADLLEDARWLVQKAIEDGTDIEDFKKQFRRLIERRGWSPKPLPAGPSDYRIRMILETNVRRSYGAGRYQQIRASQSTLPYLMWVWRDSPNPRPNHLALNGKVFRSDDPFWEVAFPPCGYGCRCTAIALSESRLKRLGKKVEKPPDPYSIAEEGFQRAPGSSPQSDRKEILERGLDRLSPPLRASVEADLKSKNLL